MFHNKLKSISKIGISAQNLITRSSSVAKQKFTNCKGVRIAYTSYGDCDAQKKPPLVLFHGLLGSKHNWDRIYDVIHQRTGRMVLNIDLRNHGDSEHSPDNTYFHMVRDVVDLLHKLELSRVSLLGHSMGGYVALAVALLRPEVVSSLAIEDASPLQFPSRVFGMKRMIDCMADMSFETNMTITEAGLLAHEHLKTITSDAHMRSYLIESLEKNDNGQFSWKANLPVLRKFLLSEDIYFPSIFQGHQYTGPTIFIGGSQSDFIRQCEFPEIKKLFPNADLTYVDGAGHFVHRQTPREFLDIICKFLIEK